MQSAGERVLRAPDDGIFHQLAGLGTSADPLCIESHGAYVLPKTGGRGTAAFYVPGAFLLLSTAALPDLRKRRSRKH